MTNTTRHSEATYCTVNIGQDRSQLTMEIMQDGEGFVPEEVEPGPNGIFHLLEMAEDCMGAVHTWLPEDSTRKTGLRIVFPILPPLEELIL